jgi:hypothetical protein
VRARPEPAGPSVTFTLRDGNLAYRWAGGGEQNTATLSKK